MSRVALAAHGLSKKQADWIASRDFLDHQSWKDVRYQALKRSDGRCQCCGRSKHQLDYDEFLNVDHIKPRRTHSWLALTLANLQVLCSACNAGKGNSDTTDWRAA